MFSRAPDFETPQDADGDNVYEVTVTATGGAETVSQDMTVTVTDVNDAPTSSGLAVTTKEDTAHSFTAAEFTFADVDGDALHSLRIDTLPATGTLTLDGAAVIAGQVIPAAGIATLVYTPAANANGDVSFTFSLSDGTAFGAPATATVSVTDVNDAPTSSGLAVTTKEDTAHSFGFVPTKVHNPPQDLIQRELPVCKHGDDSLSCFLLSRPWLIFTSGSKLRTSEA